MIARIWHATATPAGADAYQRHFTTAVLPGLRRTGGHRGAYVLRRTMDDHVELQVITLWESLDSIRAFAGDGVVTAVVEPDARAVLLSYDTTVTHHDVLTAVP
ncbi:hypothetical protein FXF51_53715 [Nonomuraea sp. PA05]|uniref:antibiotic biosynthesis monooxygenase family protein n=1 Tax=Nonomuraea sp. PA05 TaxID=2604466 RepID=UPI0011DA6341|nr:hypothetical protein [Nonomuraea sp. PA05]TYB51338.1 hypothetical protein FXF51_53715 [Nonomuraea sp. PA05]